VAVAEVLLEEVEIRTAVSLKEVAGAGGGGRWCS